MSLNKKKKKSKSKVTFKEDSEGSGPIDSDMLDFVKTDFISEFDLFRHYFKCLKKTGSLIDILEEVNRLTTIKPNRLKQCPSNYESDPKFIPPKLTKIDNDFFNLSEKVSVKFDKSRGHFVESRTKIDRGTTLTVEKSIILTNDPIIGPEKSNVYRCHHCLRIIRCFVTCPNCDVVVFCNYNCRNDSWNEYHVWECFGLQRNCWNVSSFRYVAMRLLFTGFQYDFDTEDETCDFKNGLNYKEVYRYIYKFSYKLKGKSQLDLALILKICTDLLIYLIEYSHFFSSISELPKFKGMMPYDMYMYVGGLLVRHYVQVEEHCLHHDQMIMVSPFSYDRDFLSFGIFISESLFHFSCKPNATFCVRDNYAMIKAIEDIEPGEKITVKWNLVLRENCSCNHCLEKSKLNGFVCTNCPGIVLPQRNTDIVQWQRFFLQDLSKFVRNIDLKCQRCKRKSKVEAFEKSIKLGRCHIDDFRNFKKVQDIRNAIDVYKNILQSTHIFHGYVYILAIEHWSKMRSIKCAEELAKIISKYLLLAELQLGKYSRTLLSGRCSVLMEMLDVYDGCTMSSSVARFCRNLLSSIRSVGELYCLSHKVVVLEKIIKRNYPNFNIV